MQVTAKEILKILHEDGWKEIPGRSKGSHIQLKHPEKPGKVTVPFHSGDIPMRKISYPAFFEPSGSGYAVSFPDLPGCFSFGATFEEAQREAADALGLHLYGMEKDGDDIPAPSQTLTVDPDTMPGYLISFVTVFSR